MNFTEAITSGFANYANFSGRARLSAFWWWTLFSVLVCAAAALVDIALFGVDNDWSPINTVVSLALLLPSLAVGARRLHDTGRSGWWLLLYLTVIGIFWLIYLWMQEGEVGANRYGPPVA